VIGSNIWKMKFGKPNEVVRQSQFRERDSSKFYRIFAFWDPTLVKQTLIVGTHGLDKKTNKTPRHEIEKAKRSMNKYFEQKKDKI
jgi:phage-related protein